MQHFATKKMSALSRHHILLANVDKYGAIHNRDRRDASKSTESTHLPMKRFCFRSNDFYAKHLRQHHCRMHPHSHEFCIARVQSAQYLQQQCVLFSLLCPLLRNKPGGELYQTPHAASKIASQHLPDKICLKSRVSVRLAATTRRAPFLLSLVLARI